MSEQPTLGYLLTDAARLIRRRFEQESRDIPMTTAQLQIVARLKRHEGLSQAALAGLLDIDPMTLSRHIDRMEAAGLVERRPDPNDRRARRVHTTEHARALLEADARPRRGRLRRRARRPAAGGARRPDADGLQTIIANLCRRR